MLDNQDKKFEISKAQPANIKPQDTIDLLELFYVLKKKILLILMAALIGGCVAGVYTQFFMTPVYSSMSSILVLSKETTLTSLADLQLGASLTSDYTVLIKSTPVLEQVIENLNLDTTVEELKNQISINNPTVSGGETPPENDAAGNSGYYRDKTVEYGPVRERRQGTNTGCIGEICECTWKTY